MLVGGVCKHFCPWRYSQLAEVLDSLVYLNLFRKKAGLAVVLFDQVNPTILIFRIPSPLHRGSVALTLAINFPLSAMQHCHIYAAKHPVTQMTLFADVADIFVQMLHQFLASQIPGSATCWMDSSSFMQW